MDRIARYHILLKINKDFVVIFDNFSACFVLIFYLKFFFVSYFHKLIVIFDLFSYGWDEHFFVTVKKSILVITIEQLVTYKP